MKSQFSLKSWLIGCSMLAMTTNGAFAEVVYNRGNSADPESLDPHKTSTVYEANILRDLFMGLMVQDAKALRDEARGGSLTGVVMLTRSSPGAGAQLLVNTAYLFSAGLIALGLALLVFYLITNKLILSPVRDLKETAELVR